MSDATSPKLDRRTAEWNARCTICTSADRPQIELSMARGVGKRATALKYGVSEDACFRHWHRHVPESVKAAKKAQILKPRANLEKLADEAEVGVLENLQAIRAALYNQLDGAVQIDDRTAVARLAGELHKNLELTGKLTGDLRQHRITEHVHLAVSPDFISLRQKLISALRPFPEAAAAVAAVLRGVDGAPQPRAIMIECEAVEVAA